MGMTSFVKEPRMSDKFDELKDSVKDHAGAHGDDLKGKAKSGLGEMRGDKGQEAEGKLDQAKGSLKEGLADVKDKARDLMDRDDK